jgi:hypothetical protein
MKTLLVAFVAITISGLGFARAEEKGVTEPMAKAEANIEAKAQETKAEVKKVEKKRRKMAKKAAVEVKTTEAEVKAVTEKAAESVPATK